MQAENIHAVAVLGLGTMGHGIAQSFAAAGCTVRCWDAQQAARGSLKDRITQNLKQCVAVGLVREGAVDPILSRVIPVETEQEAVADAQVVTEAIAEDLSVKQELFARLEPMVADETILASNSSTFPISRSGLRLRRPERAIVTHWFNPPHIVPTVEVVPGPRTSEQTTQTALALLKRLGKRAVHVRQEIAGFLVNRVQVAMLREVWDLLDRGIASAEDIDDAISGSLGFRLAAAGPLEVNDFGGLDILTTVFRNLAPEIRSDAQVPATVSRLVEAGHLGAKTRRGFYEYTPASLEQRRSRRDARFLALLKLLHGSSERSA